LASKPQRYLDFWTRYLERVAADHPEWRDVGTATSRNYINQSCGLRGSEIGVAFNGNGRIGHELVIYGSSSAETTLDIFRALEIRRSSFESYYGRRLVWDTRPGRKRCLIGDYRIGSIDHVGAEGDYEDYIDWFIDCGERLRATLDRVRAFARGPS
jgi:hypothetical protein